MERQKKIQEQIINNIQQTYLPQYSMDFDLAAKSNSSEIFADRRLLPSNLNSSKQHIGQSVTAVNNPISFTRKKFSDPQFLPISENIIPHDEETSFNCLDYGEKVARWVRPEQIRWSKEADQYPLTVFNHPKSKDIIQGCLGNCWFTSALSLIADIPQILNKVMITKQYSPAGLYKTRLCNRGIWQVITIDDMIPVTESNSFVFTRSQKKQLFASLIEKALAKLHGSYKALEFGRCVEGLQTLTGKPCEVLLLRSTDPKKNPNLNHLWAQIVQSRTKGYLMSCLSSNTQLDEQIFNRMGLELDHAYSILDAQQVGSRRLVRLRNPWGKKERNGTLSDADWTKLTSLPKEKLLTSSQNHGVFWIPWEAMSSFFSDITVCKISGNDHEARKSCYLSDFSSKITSAYSLDCPYGAELNIELFIAADGKHCSRSKDLAIDLFFIILNPDGSCNAYKHSLDYYITLSTTVLPGRYIIVAGSMSVVHSTKHSQVNVVVHANQPFNLDEQPSSSALIGDAFHAVGLRANNRKDFGDGVSILTFNDNGGFGFICENKANRPIRLTTDFQGSTNVISSRQAFRMVDLIPAKTKQLFAIFTRKALSDDVNIAYQLEYQALNESHGKGRVRARNSPPIPSQAIGLHVLKSVH